MPNEGRPIRPTPQEVFLAVSNWRIESTGMAPDLDAVPTRLEMPTSSCLGCGCTVPVRDRYTPPICESCRNEQQCMSCGAGVPSRLVLDRVDYGMTAPGFHIRMHGQRGVVCARCFGSAVRQCANCGEFSPYDEMYLQEVNGQNVQLCEACDSSVSYCDDCGTRHWDNEGCPEHVPCRNGMNFLVGEHESKDAPNVFFGVELEVEYRDARNAGKVRKVEQQLADLPGTFMLDGDGSLNDGVEWKSVPATLNWWLEHRKEFDERLSECVRLGARSHEPGTCGLHIHINREAFTSLGVYKLMRLIYESPVEILKLSRRARQHLERWAALEDPEVMVRKATGKLETHRYVAVNISDRHPTIELRFFRGTLRDDRLFSSIEFAAAAHEFVMDSSIRDCKWKSFVEFVMKNKRKYRQLDTELREKGLYV